MVDLAVLAVLGVRGWYGWKRGTLLMLLSLAGLFAGYVGAALLFRPVGRYLTSTFDLSPLVALPLAGGLIMALITGGLRLARHTVEQRRGVAQREGVQPAAWDSAGGALISAVWATGLVLVVAWIVMGVHGAFKVGPDISHSVTGRVTAAVTRRVTYSITQRRTGSMLAASILSMVAGQPGTGVEVMNTLMSNQRVRGLWTDSTLRNALARGDVESLRRHPTMRALVADTQFVHAAAQLGLGGTGLNMVPGGDQLAANLVTQLGPMVRSLQALGNDPEMRRLMNSPELKRAMDRGDLGALLNNAQFRQVAARFMDVLKTGTGDRGPGTERTSMSR